MAESDSGWWGWLQSAKEKVVSQSAEVLEFVAKDIDEFRNVVSEEASSLVSSTAVVLKEKFNLDEEDSTANHMKKSVSGFLNHVAEVFTPPPDDEDQQAILIQNQQPIFLDRFQAAIYAVRQEDSTYLTDPEEEEVLYEKWLTTFDLEAKQEEISQLLVDNEVVRSKYTSLVPSQVSHLTFWHRYFYKIEKLEKAEAKRQELRKRAQEIKADGEIVWDEDEEFGGSQDIPEKIQQKLLEDYEEECKNSNQKTLKSDPKASKTLKSELKDVENKESLDKNTSQQSLALSEKSRDSPSSNESNEDEWEKVPSAGDLIQLSDSPTKDPSANKNDDWETWE